MKKSSFALTCTLLLTTFAAAHGATTGVPATRRVGDVVATAVLQALGLTA